MPTLYPKCAPSEMLGFLILLDTHRGSVEIARMAEEESMGMDKLLPAIEYAQGLGLVTLSDGRATFTDSGRLLIAADIRVRKDLLRVLVERTVLFRAITRSLEQAVGGTIREDELHQIVAFSTAPPEAVQDIINWGRYTGIFRYDANQHALLRMASGSKSRPAVPQAIALPASASPPARSSSAAPADARSKAAAKPTPKPSPAAKPAAIPTPAGKVADTPKKKAPPAS